MAIIRVGKFGYLSAYHQVLSSHECIEMWFIKVILLGAPRLGKTTARRRLTGEINDIRSSGEEQEEQPSTGAVETGHSVVIRNISRNAALVTPTEWVALNNLTDEARMFIQFFYSHTQKKRAFTRKPHVGDLSNFKRMETLQKKKVLSSPFRRSRIFSGRKKREEPKPPSAKHSPPSAESSTELPQPQTLSEVAELVRNAVGPKYWKDIKHLFKDTVFVKMEDTGGQPEFMDMLPALTIGPALYLLFCKLIDELKSRYTVSYLSPSTGESTTPVESTYTVEEVLLTALASISCFKSYASAPSCKEASTHIMDAEKLVTSSSKSSLAYIVGTHKDKVTEKQIDEFDKKLQDSIRSTDFFTEGLVKFSSKKRMVLPIDNMNGGEEG